jgi:hypothetical protein
MLVTAVAGREINGSRLWLGARRLQLPGNGAMKVLLVIFLAGYLADRRLVLSAVTRRWGNIRVPTLPYLIPLGVIALLTFLILIWQRDLGAVLLLGGVTLLLIYTATNRIGFVLAGVLLVVLNVFVAYHTFGYVHGRIDVWLHPLSRAQGEGYQIAQSLYAFAHGGLRGRHRQRFPAYIPRCIPTLSSRRSVRSWAWPTAWVSSPLPPPDLAQLHRDAPAKRLRHVPRPRPDQHPRPSELNHRGQPRLIPSAGIVALRQLRRFLNPGELRHARAAAPAIGGRRGSAASPPASPNNGGEPHSTGWARISPSPVLGEGQHQRAGVRPVDRRSTSRNRIVTSPICRSCRAVASGP